MTIFIGIIVGRERRQGKRLKKALLKKTACEEAGCKGGREGGKRARRVQRGGRGRVGRAAHVGRAQRRVRDPGGVRSKNGKQTRAREGEERGQKKRGRGALEMKTVGESGEQNGTERKEYSRKEMKRSRQESPAVTPRNPQGVLSCAAVLRRCWDQLFL